MTLKMWPKISDLENEITDAQHGARGDLHTSLLPRDGTRGMLSHLVPDDHPLDLGSHDNRWYAAYLSVLICDKIEEGFAGKGIDVYGNLSPVVDDTYSLGAVGVAFKDLHLKGIAYVDIINEITAAAGVTVGGVLCKAGVIPASAYPNALLLDGSRGPVYITHGTGHFLNNYASWTDIADAMFANKDVFDGNYQVALSLGLDALAAGDTQYFRLRYFNGSAWILLVSLAVSGAKPYGVYQSAFATIPSDCKFIRLDVYRVGAARYVWGTTLVIKKV